MTLSRFRNLMQLASSILSNSYVGALSSKYVSTNAFKGVCVPYLNCYACPTALFSCPIGTLQHFMALRAVPFLLLGFLGLVGVTVGRLACGWVCPFGFLQDLVHRIPSPKWRVPYVFRYFKYGFLLVFAMALPYLTGDTWFSKICPMGTLSAGIPWELWNPVNTTTGIPVLPSAPGVPYLLAILILVSFLIWFVFSRRPFCKAVCPLGAIFALFNRTSLLRLEVGKGCDGCNLCNAVCPMDLVVPLEINSGECIRCLECTRCGHVKVASPFGNAGALLTKPGVRLDV